MKELRISKSKERINSYIDDMSFYTALSRVDKNKDFNHTQGYEILRQLSYEAQENNARKNKTILEDK